MQWVCLAVRQLLILASFTVIKGMKPSIQADTLRFTNEPNSTIYVQNNANGSFLVPCKAAGDAPLRTGWRNETVLNSRVVINTTTKGLWFIHGVQRLGSSGVHRVGIFRCMASNTAGVAMSKKFQLNFIYLQNISVHLSSPALFSNVVRLKCNVETNQAVKYTWFKNNIALSVSRDSRLDVLPSGVLRIRDYNISDDGNYSCRVENSYKVITSRSMKVVGQAASKASIHVYPGKIIQTMIGSPLTVECIHISPQKSFVTWSKLTAQGSTTLVTQAGFADLVFDAVQKSDAGKYRCLAANDKEETVVVSVEAPPSFVNKLPATTTLKEGEVLVLTCNVSGNPTPSVTWYRDGRALVKDSRTHFYRSGSEHKLVVKNAANGVYQCEAENMYGSSIDQTIVNVLAKMDPPRNVKGYALSPTTVNITWENPPGYGTVYFVVHVFDVMRMADFQEVATQNTTYHLIRNLSPYTEYAIFVQLYADGKVRGQSNAYLIKTLETAPIGPPNELKLTSYRRGTLDVTWLPPFIPERKGEIIGYEIWYSEEGGNKGKKVNVTKKFYSTTLRNLVVGAKYTVRIAARTKKGLGPFSYIVTGVVSRVSTGEILPAPLVNFRSVNKSIVVMVKPRTKVEVKEYRLTYRFLNDYLGEEKVVTIPKTQFDYELKNIVSNLEYVITVTAFDSKMSKGRPAIMIVSTKNVKVNYTMFKTSNSSDLPRMKISCEPIINSTTMFVTWQRVPTSHVPEFKVRYNIFGDQATPPKVIVTKYHNVTIDDVLPGKTYTIVIRTVFPDHPMIYSSTSSLRETHFCKVPEKKPETPPSGITCTIVKHSVQVRWRPPAKPNGQIRCYNIRWLSSKSEEIKRMVPVENSLTETRVEFYEETISNVKRDSKFIVKIDGQNSVGQSPYGYCIIDTSTIPTVPPVKNNDGRQTDSDDIEKGIIIGCIISVLVLFILVMFVCWSGCRRHDKKKRMMKENIPIPYYKSRSTPHADTVSTEVSELSTKHHHIGKKYGDEETSKESDRGVGMTPKSSRLYLNSEKIPFLPRAVNPDGSVDTSCDSQDSGVQGLGKKLSATQVALKDPDKTPLQSEDCLVETIF